ncbi:ATP12, ATP synthase F1-assembly protein,Orthogonal Bundle domain in ATP12 [Cinara cedri]|uniref:ATP12, ATP synthase F1-assembly protein,Orthogonal Bundle domain in ATP12 n=1 Tax=Cinara cedri TaxID=506608 RepID=A0A5E4MZ90_9HEMI|nr:ATP12, ATP synthase F1-assembly protein,Orthogonal Bundle domain in ATP12 [Cinara cedri]
MFSFSRFVLSMARNSIQRQYKPHKFTQILPPLSRYYAINKFYKTTNIIENNDSYGILLDNSKLKTPLGNELIVNSKALALAIAEEWAMQKEKIQTDSMHLTKLCFLTVDNPSGLSENDAVQQILSYLETDTVFFISDTDKELEKLLMDKWIPFINKFNGYFDTNLKPSKSIYVETFDSKSKATIEKYFLSLGFPALHGVLHAVETLKSLVLATCCLNQDLSVKDAVLLSKMEEEYQCMKWGRVDWIKDYIDNDSVIRLSAAMLFTYYTLNRNHKPLAKQDNEKMQQSVKN